MTEPIEEFDKEPLPLNAQVTPLLVLSLATVAVIVEVPPGAMSAELPETLTETAEDVVLDLPPPQLVNRKEKKHKMIMCTIPDRIFNGISLGEATSSFWIRIFGANTTPLAGPRRSLNSLWHVRIRQVDSRHIERVWECFTVKRLET